jgi:hypothetical protein
LVVWLALLLVVCLHGVCLVCGSSNTPPCTNSSSPLFTNSFRYVSVALLVAPVLLVAPLGGDLCFVGSVLLVARLRGDLQWLQHLAATCVLLARFCWWLDSAVTAMECSVLHLLATCAPNAACYTSWPLVQCNAACYTSWPRVHLMQHATLLGHGCNAMQRATCNAACCFVILGCMCTTIKINVLTLSLFFFAWFPRTNHHDHWTYSCCR